MDQHGGGSMASPERTESPSGTLESLKEWGRSLFLALALFILIRTFLVGAFKIPTGSMERTLLVGDFLLVNKAVFGAPIPGTDRHLPAFSDPERGEVVVFNPPHDPERSYVKRLVGIPGDTLEMREKELWVNGEPVDEPYARVSRRRGDAVHPRMAWQSNHLLAGPGAEYRPTRDNWGPLVVPGGEFFVLGDNRDNSEDSRYWGFVPRSAIRGRPMFVYYSYRSAGSGEAERWGSVRWGRIGRPIR